MLRFNPDRFTAQYDDLIRTLGIWVVYTRSDHRFRCRACFNPDTNDSPADCERCFGTGYQTTLERWKVYYSNALFRVNPANSPLTRAGWNENHQPYVFTRASEVPVVGDRFFIVDWDERRDDIARLDAQPVRSIEALRVKFVDPGIAAQVIYYTAHCDVVTEAQRQYERVLLETPITISRGE